MLQTMVRTMVLRTMAVQYRLQHRPPHRLHLLLSGNGFGHADDADDVPATSRGDKPVCQRCGLPSSIHFGQLIRANGAHYHPRCWTEERTKGPWKPKPRARRPALGPEGDSLDDL
jgi:hypothetical protein